MFCDFLFATPVWGSLKEHNDFSGVAEYCLQMKDSSEGVQKSNFGGWQSEEINLEDHEAFAPVVAGIRRAFAHVMHDCKFNQDQGFKISNAWVNINGKGDLNKRHIHPLSTFSGCAYVKLPEDSGSIRFFRSDSMRHYDMPEHGFHALNDWHEYKPFENQILIFPSWVEHEVSPNQSDEPRITIAFNLQRSS